VELSTTLIKKRNLRTKLLFILGAVFFTVVQSMPSQAAQWRIVSATYRTQTFYPGWTFEDGQYAPSASIFNTATTLALPSATSGSRITLSFMNWSALYPQMTPPQR
jgi:hypothetical protein